MASVPSGQRPSEASNGPARLDAKHNRAHFDCGNAALNSYLRQRANQDAQRGAAFSYVLGDEDANVIAYFTLSSYAIDLGTLPERLGKALPHHPLQPAALLGRLAVTKEYQGQGIGGILIAAAIELAFTANPAGSIALVVDAIDESAVKFYQKHGFLLLPEKKTLPEGKSKLFLVRDSLTKYVK